MYVYATEWTAEYCYGKTASLGCLEPDSYWKTHLTIHGLWPQYTTTGYPQSCTTEPFDISIPDKIGFDTMFTNWPNVDSLPGASDFYSFWDHEWSKHGTCSGLDQLTYFQSVINLHAKVGTPTTITNALGSSVDATTLRNSFGGATMVALQCTSGQYLNGVYTCYNQVNGLVTEQTVCPVSVQQEDTCTAQLIKIQQF